MGFHRKGWIMFISVFFTEFHRSIRIKANKSLLNVVEWVKDTNKRSLNNPDNPKVGNVDHRRWRIDHIAFSPLLTRCESWTIFIDINTLSSSHPVKKSSSKDGWRLVSVLSTMIDSDYPESTSPIFNNPVVPVQSKKNCILTTC